LWGQQHDYDSDGDCGLAADGTWTELTLDSRELENECVDVDPVCDNPLTLKVKSDKLHLAVRTAYFLALTTDGTVAEDINGNYTNAESIRERLVNFDIDDGLRRANNYDLT